MIVKVVDGLLLVLVGALAALLLASQGQPSWGAAALVAAVVGAAIA